ncbi:hypothetical protein MSAN_00416300 [Mycena sanguinolenta]|uniref:Uncharacterized protein n=1 Tax=Mycena sanguinolenta TaxID=230812 RepID=A0A8H7DI89_9AGAR|nr:hypothetical protein MSAN_00416300 [Mycena sanguinolenta]
MNQFRVVVRQPLVASSPGSSFGPTGKLKAKPPKAYSTSEELYAALTKTCAEDPEVDFSGSYIVPAPDADTVSDKVRVQMVTNDVWKATGYRFTVKDHPPTERGHKTRLWCSQDEARRSKHRGSNNDAPRVSKQGELFAKQRFPCRSRLMITCLPSPEGTRTPPGRIVTIRMHHYVRHEAYLESPTEAGTGNGGVEAPGPPTTALVPQAQTAQFLTAITAPLPPALMGMSMSVRQEIELPRAVPVAPPPAAARPGGRVGCCAAVAVPFSVVLRSAAAADRSAARGAGASAPAGAASFTAAYRGTASTPLATGTSSALAASPTPRSIPPSLRRPHSNRSSCHINTSIPILTRIHILTHIRTRTHRPHKCSSSIHRRTRTHTPTHHPRPHKCNSNPAHATAAPTNATAASTAPSATAPRPLKCNSIHNRPPQHQLTPDEFQHRMRTHIARIRDFCDGLEYQVQFNDYRMLEALERDAAPFIEMLEGCLRAEGRLS